MSATLPATARTEQSARDAMTDTAKDAAALEVRIRAPFGELRPQSTLLISSRRSSAPPSHPQR